MDELSPRARAYLEAFADEHQAPELVPPWQPHATAVSLWRFVVPMLGVAAAAVVGWGASEATTVELAGAKRFEAAPHRVERAAIEQAMQPRSPAPIVTRRIVPKQPVALPSVAAPDQPRRDRGPSALRRELALVDAAKAALRRGDREAARRALARHAERFEDGLLAPERRRLIERIDEDTESAGCVHSSCVRSDD